MFYRSLYYRGPDLFTQLETEGDVLVLSRFDVQFLNSDHHLIAFELGGKGTPVDSDVSPGTFRIHFSDGDHGILGNENDEIEVKVGYVHFDDSPYLATDNYLTVTGIGNRREDVSVAIPTPEEDEVIALVGFSFFHTNDQSNHHIRTIQVRYFEDPSEFIVRFRDNSPDDDEFRFFIVYTILKKSLDIPSNFDLGDVQRQRIEFVKEATVRKEAPGYSLLAGFSFQFLDTDHHIRRIAVNVEDRDTLYVCFTDDEEDNPVLGFVDYIPLIST